jgi:hypothetical protein
MADVSPPKPNVGASGAPVRFIARFVSSRRRRAITEAIEARRLRVVESLDLLAEASLPRLARHSLWLLIGSGIALAGLDLAARLPHMSGPLLGGGPPVQRGAVLLVVNAAAYVAVLPAHEALHAATILTLGGRPRFGLKLPLAAYCTAPGQLFTRNGYVAIALAPLVVISVIGAAATWLAPNLGACILFGLAGNVSGAVADLWAVARIRRLPTGVLIEDTETGFTAYETM